MSADAPPVIHWFRRDLRIADNTALLHASRNFPRVVPCHILSTWTKHHAWTGPKRQHFLCGCLASLDANLRAIGGRLIIRSGDAIEQLGLLARETGAVAITFNRDPDPHGRRTEEALERKCREWGVECHGRDDVTVHTAGEILTGNGQPYRVYTPYSHNWLSREKPGVLPKPRDLGTPGNIRSEDLPTVAHWRLEEPDAGIVEPGERAARQRLKRALERRLPDYAERRDHPAADGTSRLSQDLRFGLLSPRTVYHRAEKARRTARSADTRDSLLAFIKELAWREFYMAVLHHFPEVLEHEFNPDWRGLPWDEPGERFDAWTAGRTGFPIVDAGIRELLATGHMHNRLRMITAMFLTKDLHLDWRLGESFFMRHLVDGEIASNNGGWQWSAGTGADAAPYFRIQNPWTQSARHDPQGEYIKRWVPELAGVPAGTLHRAPENGRPVAKDYPLPCVDHGEERNRTLTLFNEHKAHQKI